MSAAGRALWKALDNPSDWTVASHFIFHKPSRMAFWMANGPVFFNGDMIRDTPKCIGLIERYWLYFKARQIVAQQVSMRMRGEIKP